MATEPVTGSAFEATGFEAVAEREGAVALGPWRLALRRLRRHKIGLAFGALFLVLVAAALLAPVWAHDVAHTAPFPNPLTDTIKVDGKTVDIVAPNGTPIGPQWFAAGGKYF